MKKGVLLIAVMLVAVVAYVGLSGAGLLGEQTQVQVSINQHGLDEAIAGGITGITLKFYTTTDGGNVMVATKTLDMIASQTLHVSGLADQGSISIIATLSNGDTGEMPTTGDGHVASGQSIVIVIGDNPGPGGYGTYWNVV